MIFLQGDAVDAAPNTGARLMLDGISNTDAESTALVPASLASARVALAAHPFAAPVTALATIDRVAPYASQMAATGLGFSADDGARRLWSVSKVPLYGSDGRVWPDAFGTRRDDTGARLGIVGPRYKPLQNQQLAEALELAFGHLPAGIRPTIANAGALGDGPGFGAGSRNIGARVFAQLALPPQLSGLLRVDADRDSDTVAYLTLTNTHDGTSSAAIGASATRIVCRNTWQLAHAESKRRGGLSLKHTAGNVDQYRQHVSAWFKATAQGYAMQGEKLRAYAAHRLSAAVVEDVAAKVLFGEVIEPEERTKAQTANVEAIIEMIEARDGEFVARGDVTAYSVLQSVTADEMHRRPARGELAAQTETRLWRVLTDDEVIPRAFKALDAIVMR